MFTLKEALAVIAKKTEFSCNEREFGFVIDYHVSLKDTFKGDDWRETMILQNLRGTCFDHSGAIIRLPYHKFHNLNENEEYAEKNFDFDDYDNPHQIQEKLDGSMIAPIYFGGKWRLGTRAGITDVSMKAEKLLESWLDTSPQKYEAYINFIAECGVRGYTPIFEFCSRDNRIVIEYLEPDLILTGVRDMTNGNYVNTKLRMFTGNPRIVVAKTHFNPMNLSISEFSKIIKECVGSEGVVIKFNDGRFVKIKGDDYCLKHKALDGLRFEKDVLKLVLSNEIDDVMPLVTPEVRARLVSYRDNVFKNINSHQSMMEEVYAVCSVQLSKKDFAEKVKNSIYRAGLFKMWDGKEYSLVDFALTKCSSISSVEEIRWLIGKSYLEF